MIDNYLEDIILSLNENPYIEGFEIIKKKITGTDGYIRLKAKLTNNNLLEISLYCQKRGTSVEAVGCGRGAFQDGVQRDCSLP